MRSSLFLLMLMLFGCGKEVSISHSKLEKYSSITEAERIQLSRNGTLLRTGIDVISLGSSSYNVSQKSSHLALKFISSRPQGSQTNVRFRGEVKGKELVLETIEQI